MPSSMFSVAVASAAVGSDIFTGGTGLGAKQAMKGSGKPRRLHGIALTGGNSAGEAGIDLYAGSKYLGSFKTTTSGAVTPKMDADLQPIYSEDYVMGDLMGIVNAAPTVNPLQILVSWEDKVGGGFVTDSLKIQGGGFAPRRSYGGGGFRKRRSYRSRRY